MTAFSDDDVGRKKKKNGEKNKTQKTTGVDRDSERFWRNGTDTSAVRLPFTGETGR